jgi:starch synthase/alpha-amylase
MFNHSAQPRILFVTPEALFVPHKLDNKATYFVNNKGGLNNYLSGLIFDLYCFGVDVHVVQPDYRKIFSAVSQKTKDNNSKKIPAERVHLTEDRAFFYSNDPASNSKWENTKISIAFQREAINRIIPEIQPDLLHCHDWMTGLIPAMAKVFEIPCLFTVQNPDTIKTFLSHIEDMGIDAALFWQHLFYDRYPINYEEIRESNLANFLLSGILSANFVNVSSDFFMARNGEYQSPIAELPFWEVLAQKKSAGCAKINSNLAKTEQYIEIYKQLLQQFLSQPEQEKIKFSPAARFPLSRKS